MEIKTHPFFKSVAWEDLREKHVVPPFKPDVKSQADAKYVPKTYLNDTAHDSIDK